MRTSTLPWDCGWLVEIKLVGWLVGWLKWLIGTDGGRNNKGDRSTEERIQKLRERLKEERPCWAEGLVCLFVCLFVRRRKKVELHRSVGGGLRGLGGEEGQVGCDV